MTVNTLIMGDRVVMCVKKKNAARSWDRESGTNVEGWAGEACGFEQRPQAHE